MNGLLQSLKQLFAKAGVPEDEINSALEIEDQVETQEEVVQEEQAKEPTQEETQENVTTLDALEEKLKTLEAQNAEFKDALEQKETELAQAKDEKQKLEDKIAGLSERVSNMLGGAFGNPEDTAKPIVTDFRQALKECNGDYVKARQTYPDAFKNITK